MGNDCLRILSITSNDLGIAWGPAIHYLELWNELSRRFPNTKVTGISPTWTQKKEIIAPEFDSKNIAVPNIPSFRQLVYDIFVAVYIVRTRRIFDMRYIRVSHWHMLQIVVLWLFSMRFVIEMNGLATEDSKSAGASYFRKLIVQWQERWLVNNASGAIAVSQGIADSVAKRHRPGYRINVIKNGVSASFIRGGQSATVRVTNPVGIYVGTFTSWDGSAEIVELARCVPSVTFVMVGDGNRRMAIEATAPSNVQFVGTVDYVNLPAIYATADFGIVLYEFERHRNVKVSSLKTLEYVASKLPIFSTAISGQEFVAEKGFGYLIAETESVQDGFKSFLSELPVFRQAYSRQPREYFDSLTWGRVALETHAVLELTNNS